MILALNTKRVIRNFVVGGGILFVALVSSGCQHSFWDKKIRADEYTGSIYKFAETNHPIKVGRGSLEMSISVGSRDTVLNRHKLNELRTFLHYYRDQGTGRLRVRMPTRSRNQHALRLVMADVVHVMEQMSMGPESVQVKKYSGRSGSASVLRLSFERYVAHGPNCGQWNENFAQDENNSNSDYWGCASQNNLAAMIANPRDLIGPRGWSPRDARRRDTVFDKYVKGEPTGARRSSEERVDQTSGIGK